MNFRNLSAWCVLHPIPPLVLFIILTVGGLFAFFNLGIDETPNIDVPAVSVAVTQPGASPAELETQVTRRVEDAVAGLGNIKHITSTINEGISSTIIEFELGTNSDRATNDVRNEIAKTRQQLPQGIDEPVVQRLEYTGGPFVTYTISSPSKSVEELSWIIDNDIARALLSVPGVGQVQRSGGVDREIRVNLDPSRLESLGVTADMISTQLRALNINLPGGRGELGPQEQAIRTLGSALTVEELSGVQIVLPNSKYARLDTIGTVTDGTAEQRQIALLEGKPVVAFSLVRSPGSNMVDVETKADKKLEELKTLLPKDVHITRIRSEAIFVHQSYEACMEHLLLGAILAVIVIWCFLRDWRAAIISALAMPLSLIPTFAVMKIVGFTLNNMSLLGLSLVIGVLVDDAIVEIENIVRHMGFGKTPYRASLDAADEIGLAVVATTMTLVVVFVPVGFMGGIPGQFLRQFGITVAVAVLSSLLVARMLTPLMAAYFLKPVKEESHRRGILATIYDKVLHSALRHRIVTLSAGVLFFIVGIILFKMMPTSVMGQVDRGETLLTVELSPGSTLKDCRAAVERIVSIVGTCPEVRQVFATVGAPTAGRGRSSGSAGEVHKANVFIMLKPRGERALSQQQFEMKVRPLVAKVPGARMAFTRVGGITGKLKVVLTSSDGVSLMRTSEALADQMRGIPRVSDVVSSASLQRPEIIVQPNFAAAAEQGVGVQTIARTALIATLGDVEANLPKFNLTDRQINIRVQLDPKYRDDLEAIRNLRVSGRGRLVPLSSVADISIGSGPAQLNRLDRARQVTIEASMAPGLNLGDALNKVHLLPAYVSKPTEVIDTPSGDAEIQKDIFGGFAAALSGAVLLIYAVLVLLFDGFLHPLTIMMSLPLALGGALMALVIAGQSLGFYSLIGIVMLMGLVTKNAILLVEYCLMSMRDGAPRSQAIIEAGRTRMRPIMMTTVAMIAGMMPIAIGVGAGSEARAPMAICVVGGLITSTLLTLVVVPVVFTCIDDFQLWIKRKVGFKVSKEDYQVTTVKETVYSESEK